MRSSGRCGLLELLHARVEAVPAVQPAVDSSPYALPVAAARQHGDVVVPHVRRKDPRRHRRVEGKVGLPLERNAEPPPVAAVVRATRELDEAAPVETDAVARARVAEVGPTLVHAPVVRLPAVLVDRGEVGHLRRDRGERGDRGVWIAETLLGERLAQRRPVTADIGHPAAEQPGDLLRRTAPWSHRVPTAAGSASGAWNVFM